MAERNPNPQTLETRTTSTEVSDLGSLPIEQAGQLVRRQSDLATGGTAATPNAVFSDTQPAQGMPPGGRATIAPTTTGAPVTDSGNVIPRTDGTTATPPFPGSGGDIAPVQPGLVQPGVTPDTDAELDSIPALW
jgi:hypothetical protein